MNNITLTQPALNEGHPLDIRIYKKGRRCGVCHCLLTIYTPGHFCHPHMEIGRKKDIEMAEKREEEKKKKLKY